jgi:hypothetical protein
MSDMLSACRCLSKSFLVTPRLEHNGTNADKLKHIGHPLVNGSHTVTLAGELIFLLEGNYFQALA